MRCLAVVTWVGLQPLLAATSPELLPGLPGSPLREAVPSPTPAPSPPYEPSLPAEEAPTESDDDAPPAPPPPQALLPATSEWEELSDDGTFERAFIVRGGEAVFRISSRDVEVVESTANPGYEVAVNRWSRSSLILSFESVEQTSRIWVMWRNGPYAEVTETV
jgi:hypothetical protein